MLLHVLCSDCLVSVNYVGLWRVFCGFCVLRGYICCYPLSVDLSIVMHGYLSMFVVLCCCQCLCLCIVVNVSVPILLSMCLCYLSVFAFAYCLLVRGDGRVRWQYTTASKSLRLLRNQLTLPSFVLFLVRIIGCQCLCCGLLSMFSCMYLVYCLTCFHQLRCCFCGFSVIVELPV